LGEFCIKVDGSITAQWAKIGEPNQTVNKPDAAYFLAATDIILRLILGDIARASEPIKNVSGQFIALTLYCPAMSFGNRTIYFTGSF